MSEPRFFSDEEVLKIADEVVAEAGHDYVYPVRTALGLGNGCDYVRDGECSCLIARIAHKMGAPIEWLATMENTSAMTVCGFPAEWVDLDRHTENTYFRVSKRAATALEVAQAAQDGGAPWSVALDRVCSQLGHATD